MRNCLAVQWRRRAIATLLFAGLTGPAVAESPTDLASRPGAPVVEPATQTALAVRWPVVGDRNATARIEVHVRRKGDGNWTRAHDLFRTHPDHVSPDNRVARGWLFAGSIVDLVAGTSYEMKLSLQDPDGGSAEQVLSLRTLEEPALPDGMRERHVRPLGPGESGGGTGTREDPFRGLRAAAAAAEPGDLILLASGIYAERDVQPRDGAPGRPIVFRGGGEAVIDGGGAETLIDIRRRRFLWFEGLAFRNAATLVAADRASDIVLRRNRFEVGHYGIRAHGASYAQSQRILVSDSTFEGTLPWPPPRRSPDIYAVSLTGSGHVVRFNRIRKVRDGVSNPEVGRLSASDIHNNDIALCADDGIEADYSDTSLRVFRNRILDCFVGVSAQPARGGPLYIYRNFIYNARHTPFKLHNQTSGILIYHNTSVKSGSPFLIQPGGETVNDVVTRNNLFVGTAGPGLNSSGKMIRCDFDSDGYAWRSGPFAAWNGSVFRSTVEAQRQGELYARYGAVDMGPRRPFESALWPPADPLAQSDPARLDPRLASNARAVDRGVMLHGFNDSFGGKAPDLGCCEMGEPVPHYGPRAEASPPR